MFFLGLNFQESNVVALVGADEFCGVVGLIAENDFDGLGSFDDVIVGEDVAARVNNEARAGTFDGDRVHKEIVLGGFSENVGYSRGAQTGNAHVNGFIVGEGGIALQNRRQRMATGRTQSLTTGRMAAAYARI